MTDFLNYGTAEYVAEANLDDVINILKPLGLANNNSYYVQVISRDAFGSTTYML